VHLWIEEEKHGDAQQRVPLGHFQTVRISSVHFSLLLRVAVKVPENFMSQMNKHRFCFCLECEIHFNDELSFYFK